MGSMGASDGAVGMWGNSGIGAAWKIPGSLFRFSYPLLQQVAHEMILYSLRHALHEDCADYIQERYETLNINRDGKYHDNDWFRQRILFQRRGGKMLHYRLLAMHREMSSDFSSAIDCYEHAAAEAKRTGNHPEVITALTKCLRLQQAHPGMKRGSAQSNGPGTLTHYQ